MEESLVKLFETMPYIVSFLGGFITFVSPCILPLIPAYLSYISGLSYQQISGQNEISTAERLNIVFASLSFIFGFSLIFVLLGVVVDGAIGDFLKSPEMAIVAGGLVIIFGIHMMKIIDIPFLNFEMRANFGSTEKQKGFMKFITPFILGLSFALGWTPCVGPILGSILTYASGNDAVLLMSTFALGLAVPFFLSALLTSYAVSLMAKVKRHFRIVEIVSGLLLIGIGIAIASGSMGLLTELLSFGGGEN